MDDKSIIPESCACDAIRAERMNRKDRIGHKDRHGFFSLSQLREDEFVIAPGIIYRKATDA